MPIRHYVVRPKNDCWLLERKDTGCELALYNTRQRAVRCGETLAQDNQPSLLEIHTGMHVEERRYPLPLVAKETLILENLE
jgi:hypothetical protein